MVTFIQLILQTVMSVARNTFANIRNAVQNAAPAVRSYVVSLIEIGVIGVAGPLLIGAVALLGHVLTKGFVSFLKFIEWDTTFGWSGLIVLCNLTEWVWFILFVVAGFLSCAYIAALGAIASPVGVAANGLASAKKQEIPKEPVEVGFLGIPSAVATQIRDARISMQNAASEGLEKYRVQVQKSIAIFGAAYFFSAFFPSLRLVMAGFVLGRIVYGAATSKTLRWAIIATIVWAVLASAFPSLSPFQYFFGAPVTEVTETHIKYGVKGFWKGFNGFVTGEYHTPAFWILVFFVGLVLLKYIPKWFGGSATASESKVSGKGLAVIAVIGVLAFLAYNWTIARAATSTAAEIERHKQAVALAALLERERTAKTIGGAVVGSTPRTPTQVQMTEWHGLLNPKFTPFQFSPDWSVQIERPRDQSIRFDPDGLTPEIRINGSEILKRNHDGTAPFPSYTRYIQVRMTNGTSPISMVAGVGPEIRPLRP